MSAALASTGSVSAIVETANGTGGDDLRSVAVPTRSSYNIRGETDEETTVYVIEASTPGPTVLVVGGVHGNEKSGWRSARDIKDWWIDAGMLVVLPRANEPAIEADTRNGNDGDLNRQFPSESAPTCALARAIWEVVLRHRPDFVWDLHSSRGIHSEGTGVGQAVFPTQAGDARTRAERIREYLNEHHVPNSRPEYAFTGSNGTDGSRAMLKHKVGADLDTPAIIFETTYRDLALDTQIAWTKAAVRRFLERYGLICMDRGTTVCDRVKTV